jgi:hypothetical protein
MVTDMRQFVILSTEIFGLFRLGWSHEAALFQGDS